MFFFFKKVRSENLNLTVTLIETLPKAFGYAILKQHQNKIQDHNPKFLGKEKLDQDLKIDILSIREMNLKEHIYS